MAQLGAMEFRDKMIKGDGTILGSLSLGTQTTVADLLKKFCRAPPLALLELCYGRKEFNFVESLLQHADDLDFTQDTLSAVGASPMINPILNGVLAGLNRRRRHQRFKLGHYNLELDRLRYAETASLLDSDLAATEVKSEPVAQQNGKTRKPASEMCWFFQRKGGCRRKPCPYIHKCMICDKLDHGAFECNIRKGKVESSSDTTETAQDRPPNPRSRRARAH